MHGAFGQFILAVVLVGGGGFLLLGQVARIHEAAGRRQPGGRRARAAMQMAAHPTPRRLKAAARAEIRKAKGVAKATDWLEHRRWRRDNGLPDPPSRGGAVGRALGTLIRPTVTASAASSTDAPATAPKPPPAPAPAPATATTPTTGGTAAMPASAGSGALEQFIQGINQVHAEALNGNILSKQNALKACDEGSIRFSSMAAMLSRAMSEPGSNYGPEITEPIAKAAQHLQAAAMAFGEADTNLTTLIHTTVGDLARSGRQAPHHAEMSETGSI